MAFEYKRDLANLPPKIRCDIGKEWKTPEHFSKNKLHQFANGMRRNPKKVTALSSGIPCRVHSGEPETMLKCQGPCGKTYGLDKFSRNTRTRGIYWCEECTSWQLANEASFMPYPIPYAPRVDDTKDKEAQEAEAAAAQTETVIDDDTSSIAPSVAPSIAPSFAPSFAQSGMSEHAHSIAMSGTYGGPTGSSAVPTAEGSVYSETTARGGASGRGPQQFNAWTPDGVLHRVTKAPTVISELSAVTTSRKTVEVGSNGWVKAPMRKTPAEAPDYIKFGRCQPTINDDYISDDGLSEDEI